MRFTVIDSVGGVSFVARCDTLFALVAACQANPQTLSELLERLADLQPRLRDYIESGLAVFDERHVAGQLGPIHDALEFLTSAELPVFRVIDGRTRQASLEPVTSGLVLFNLKDRRIVQVQNTYAEVRRKGRITLSTSGRSGSRVIRYELPPDWAIVP